MPKKTALIIRHAAHGDMIISSVLPPYLKKSGYTVHVLTGKIGMDMLAGNPNIDRLLRFPDNVLPIEELGSYYDFVANEYENPICLSHSIEGTYLHPYPDPNWYATLKKRRAIAKGHNYYEDVIRTAGYEPDPKLGAHGHLYFNQEELLFSNNFRKKFKDRFIIVWALSGSSLHKLYLYFQQVVEMIVKAIPEALIVTVGNINDCMLSFEHPNILNFGYYQKPIKMSLALTRIADLVVGPETAVLNAAGCFDTPKICLLTHSGKENLTKTWTNDYSLQSATYCSPCFLLHRVRYIWRGKCPVDKRFLAKYGAEIPACAGEGFPPKVVFASIMEVYDTFKGAK